MNNKTRNLARNLLAIMAMGASANAIPGVVNAAEAPAATKTVTAKTGEKNAAAPASKGGFDLKSAGVGALAGGLGLGGLGLLFGAKVLGSGGSSYYLGQDGKVDYAMSSLITAAKGLTSKIAEASQANLDKSDLAQIAYAIADSCVVVKHSAVEENSALTVDATLNYILEGKMGKNAARASDKAYKHDVKKETLDNAIPADGIVIEFKEDKKWSDYIDKDKIANDDGKGAQSDIVRALKFKSPLLVEALDAAKAKITVKPNSLTVEVGGKTINLTEFKTADFKDSKMEVK